MKLTKEDWAEMTRGERISFWIIDPWHAVPIMLALGALYVAVRLA